MLGIIKSQASSTQGSWAQGQGHCGYFKKNFVIALVPAFNDGF